MVGNKLRNYLQEQGWEVDGRKQGLFERIWEQKINFNGTSNYWTKYRQDKELFAKIRTKDCWKRNKE